MRITEEEQEIRRKRMLHAAFDLFSKFGIDDVSMARIANEAKVSPKSIFRYFESKARLLQETQDILWKEIVDYIADSNMQAVSESKTGLEELQIHLFGFERLYQEHSNYILFAYLYKAYLIRNNLKLPSGTEDTMVKKVSPLFLNALQRGQADGSITTLQSDMVLFQRVWYTMRHFAEQMVVFDRIYYGGDNPWEDVFSHLILQIIKDIKAVE